MISELELQKYYEQYGKEKVDEVVKKLNYKKDSVELPKDEDHNNPILYVFRHGQTTDNLSMTFSGWRDPDLTELGEKQALLLADKLKDKKIDMLIASDRIRAVKTMKLAVSLNEMAKNLEIIQDPRLRERDYGIYQGKSKFEMMLSDPEKLASFRRGYSTPPEGGESIEMTSKRVNEFLDEILPLMKAHKLNVAISCHGNSIRPIRQKFEGLSNDEMAKVESPLAQDYAAYEIK